MKKFSLFLLSILVLAIGCQEDDMMPPDTNPNPTEEVTRIANSVLGMVIDEDGLPVADALVSMETSTTLTDENGVFRLNNVQVPSNRAFVKVEKAGYFHGSRTYIPGEGSLDRVRIRLLERTIVSSFAASQGGVAQLDDDLTVTFPANGFVDLNGNTYSGNVDVAAVYLDPTDPQLAEIMPGNLYALNTDNEEQILQTFGMAGVELTGDQGQELQIADGQKAELRMQVPSALLADAPASIPLWHFDEEEGIWLEEGSASLIGNEYVGEVSHFSFWNCDVPADFIYLDGKVIWKGGQPVANLLIEIESASIGSAYDVTDGEGVFEGYVPNGDPLVLNVLDNCGTVVYSQDLGSFTNDVSLPTIELDPSTLSTNFSEIEGSVENCDGEPVQNGYVLIDLEGDNNSTTLPINNGLFSGVVSTCSAVELLVVAIDQDADKEASIIVDVEPEIDLGTLVACDNLQEFIEYTMDGVTYTLIEDMGIIDSLDFTMIYHTDVAGNNFNNFQLEIEGTEVGTYPAISCLIQGDFAFIPNVDITVNVTQNDNTLGGFIKGDFSGTFVTQQGTGVTKTVDGSFSIRND
jgi:hypothetical protein